VLSERRVRVLQLDPDLGGSLDGEALSEACARCTAPLIVLARGSQLPTGADPSHYLGLLVHSGALIYRLRVAGRETIDLVGPGDVIRPWTGDDVGADLFPGGEWDVLENAQLAALDLRFMRESERWPELGIALSDRMARHARSLALRLAVSQIPQVTARVQIILWQLADRFGYVDRDGTVIPLRLSHQLIAELVCARREVVSRRLAELRTRGIVVPDRRGWRLCGATGRDGLREGFSDALPAQPGTRSAEDVT
jgi:CRP/FNR family cyclic AMP-dependent transcriptional regulator